MKVQKIRIKKDDRLISPFIFLELSKKFKLYPYIRRIVIDESFKTFENRDKEFYKNLSSE
ncbi:MAG: EAL domain-containing protein (putative c-di-GMP-specific phosphodiesterase class I) [Sulfurimonas sp.]|jgi:EAL domain-containing protein (putative c-di-GMP-specific phosphodiesterase class I)